MNAETKRDLKTAGLWAAGIGALVTGAILLVPAAPRARLDWDNAPGATIAVIEASTNLVDWQPVGTVTNQNSFSRERTEAAEFYRVGHPTNRSAGQWWDGWQGRYRSD